MSRINVLICLLLVMLVSARPLCAELNLIQRSVGLGDPEWEEGHTELELGDANGDGHLDILSVGDHGNPLINSTERGLMCWLGNGAGVWDSHMVGHFGYGGIGLGDLNRDGLLDVAWGVHHDYAGGGIGDQLIGAALGDGTGLGWTEWDEGLATTGETWGMFATDVADFDGDGLLDILSQSFGGSNGIRIYRNLGDGTWAPALILSGGTVYYTIETGDFNSDGFMDFACARSGGTVYLGDGEFGFTSHNTGLPATTPGAVEVGDFDGDGCDDLLLDLGSSGVHAYRYDLQGEQWQDLSTGLPTVNVEQVQLGDLNDDGLLDAVTYDGPIGRTFLGDGTGNWTADATWVMPSPGDGNALRVDGDIDHDGCEDIVILAEMSGFPFYRNQLRVYSPWVEPQTLSARVAFPDGGETLRLGSNRELRWTAAQPAGQGESTAALYLSTSGEDGPWDLIAEDIPNSGRHGWVVAGAPSDHCRLEVRVATAHAEVVARSPADFRILSSGVTSVPGSGEATRPEGWLRCSPNPVVGQATLRWSRGASTPAVIRVYTLTGRLVVERRIAVGVREGSSLWTPDPTLAAGVYLAQIIGEGREASTKLVLLGNGK